MSLSSLSLAFARLKSAVTVGGSADLGFRRSGRKTVIERAFATSPLRLLMPRNHGDAAWVFVANFGGGLVDGDRLGIRVEVAEGASAMLGTQASTKVYRSPNGCSQHVDAALSDDATLALLPDPVVCFAGAHYTQQIHIAMSPRASLFLVDGYTCGRSARGERWAFGRYCSRTTITRAGTDLLVDATLLDAGPGALAARMGPFDVVLSALAIGPRFASVRSAMLDSTFPRGGTVLAAASPVGCDGAIVRVAAHRFEQASLALRPSFAELAHVLGDDPFARKW